LHALALARHATQHRADARHELARAEGFGEIVVGTHLEAHHAVDFLAPGGEHDDRYATHRADAAQHLEARELRQHHIQHHELDGGPAALLHALLPRAGSERREPLGGEILRQHRAQLPIVIDDEQCGPGLARTVRLIHLATIHALTLSRLRGV